MIAGVYRVGGPPPGTPAPQFLEETFTPAMVGMVAYVRSENVYYVRTDKGWRVLTAEELGWILGPTA